MERRPNVMIENAQFIFTKNFQGDPAKSGKYPSTNRTANVTIPDMAQVEELIALGYPVSRYPKEDMEGVDTRYFIPIQVKYRNRYGEEMNYPPKVILVCGDYQERLTEDTIGRVDDLYITNVNVILNPCYNEEHDSWTMYVRTMYVEYDENYGDPFAKRYSKKPVDDEPPFDM